MSLHTVKKQSNLIDQTRRVPGDEIHRQSLQDDAHAVEHRLLDRAK